MSVAYLTHYQLRNIRPRRSRSLTHRKCRSVSAGLHHVLQAEYVQVYSAPLGPNARLLHRLRHRHAENVQVGWTQYISDLVEEYKQNV